MPRETIAGLKNVIKALERKQRTLQDRVSTIEGTEEDLRRKLLDEVRKNEELTKHLAVVKSDYLSASNKLAISDGKLSFAQDLLQFALDPENA